MKNDMKWNFRPWKWFLLIDMQNLKFRAAYSSKQLDFYPPPSFQPEVFPQKFLRAQRVSKGLGEGQDYNSCKGHKYKMFFMTLLGAFFSKGS